MRILRGLSRENRLSLVLGVGLVISVIHQPNQPLIEYLYLPVAGSLMVWLVTVEYIADLRKKHELELGSKWIWIPLAILAGTIVIRPLYEVIVGGDVGWIDLAYSGYAVGLFGLYVVTRKLGSGIFTPFIAGVIITSITLIITGFINPGIKQGGLISPTNYDMATGFLIFGTLVCVWRKQWILTSIALIGLFFTGADEAVFSVGVVFATVLIRRDFSKKLILPIAALGLCLIICTPLGITEELYSPTAQKVEYATEGDWLEATGYRVTGNWQISELKLFGNGYYINWDDSYKGKIPHNVPLIIVEQIGIIGALAWCFVTGYCLIKTKMKYAWIGLLSLCVFDHFIWTQAAPYWWALIGVSTSATIKSDLIYKEENDD